MWIKALWAVFTLAVLLVPGPYWFMGILLSLSFAVFLGWLFFAPSKRFQTQAKTAVGEESSAVAAPDPSAGYAGAAEVAEQMRALDEEEAQDDAEPIQQPVSDRDEPVEEQSWQSRLEGGYRP